MQDSPQVLMKFSGRQYRDAVGIKIPAIASRSEGFGKKGIFLRCTSKKSEERHTFTQTSQLLTQNPPENRTLIERKVPEENIDLGKEVFPPPFSTGLFFAPRNYQQRTTTSSQRCIRETNKEFRGTPLLLTILTILLNMVERLRQ
ncbi:hypothetical protein TNIN_237381 [Trichonephila inaurata madagascariensis]|uniref:Uncharacterized protein n=1 Tax=Trichonephila inaurata madagascariensis TaxID=2747483 RepID=A0A8X6Y2W8_9ARAC|nr:hypothetical protein TNIN_237381 [Trichonephila inaurata madagascariensis]